MQRFLSILLPVQNCQDILGHLVREQLEVLPEVVDHFEMIIVDDASRDATIEVADMLSIEFPQVFAYRHAQPRGRREQLRTALRRSTGEHLLIQDPHYSLPSQRFHDFVPLIESHEIVLATPDSIAIGQNGAWQRIDHAPSSEGVILFQRQLLPEIDDVLTDLEALRSRLGDQELRWHELRFHARQFSPSWREKLSASTSMNHDTAVPSPKSAQVASSQTTDAEAAW